MIESGKCGLMCVSIFKLLFGNMPYQHFVTADTFPELFEFKPARSWTSAVWFAPHNREARLETLAKAANLCDL